MNECYLHWVLNFWPSVHLVPTFAGRCTMRFFVLVCKSHRILNVLPSVLSVLWFFMSGSGWGTEEQTGVQSMRHEADHWRGPLQRPQIQRSVPRSPSQGHFYVILSRQGEVQRGYLMASSPSILLTWIFLF